MNILLVFKFVNNIFSLFGNSLFDILDIDEHFEDKIREAITPFDGKNSSP